MYPQSNKTAIYKGREYRLLFAGKTKFGFGVKLGFVDGTKEFWASDATQVSGPDIDAARAAAVQKKETIAESRAADANIDVPCPAGRAYMPFQKAGIDWALKHPNTLLADEPGLGKTIQVIGVINADETVKKVLVICPATLKLNWARELGAWLVRPMTTGIASGANFPDTDIIIVNYDILAKNHDKIHTTPWDLVVVDESHFLKNPSAIRSQEVLGSATLDVTRGRHIVPTLQARRKMALTGTPIPNRPIEAQPICRWLAPDQKEFNFWYFAKAYCAAYNNGYGWDFGGAQNLDKLQDALRSTIMIRRRKEQVLTELPAKRRQVIELSANGAAGAVHAEAEAYAKHEDELEALAVQVELSKASDDPEDYRKAVARLHSAQTAAFAEMAGMRHATAVAKIPQVIEHITNCIEDSPNKKLVVWAHHIDVIEALQSQFKETAVSVYGDVPPNRRQALIDRFQTDPTCMLFIGGITAAGVGITLTAADHAIFAELDWVPGNVTQAEDRCHRIGQTNSVLIQHLVLEGSLDARMARILVEKQDVADRALDRETIQAPVTPLRKDAVVDKEPPASVSDIGKIAARMKLENIAAVHKALRILASSDPDGATILNGVGFNKFDGRIGHDLANRIELSPKAAAVGARLVRKYRGQLSAALVALATAPLTTGKESA